jgi:NADPH-dependent ferric siderophore reductase
MSDTDRSMDELLAVKTFLTTVHTVEDVHPHLRRITFKGGDLADFWWPSPDTFLYVLLPPPGRSELTIDQSFSWETVGAMAPEDQPVGAYYTVRDWRPDVTELDALFVLHGDEGQASAWAGRAAAGDPVALWGPRSVYAPPTETDQLLLVADETGLPAVAVILEQAPAAWPVRVLAEVADEAHRQPLPDRPGAEVTWLHRGDREAGTTTLLPDAVRALPELAPTTYCWGGGESRAVTAARKHLRHERGFAQPSVDMVGYWRHPTSPIEEG